MTLCHSIVSQKIYLILKLLRLSVLANTYFSFLAVVVLLAVYLLISAVRVLDDILSLGSPFLERI